jgi:two-component system sensor histidine kinase KdpD
MADHRQNPDKLLKQAEELERHNKVGKLKIYLGAAPGVGKTHEMLQDAMAARNKGLDVVIGVVESHGRTEINAMIGDFEFIPKKNIDYHGRNLQEFDLDAGLKRSPGLILMDEMAHTNVDGMRHKKRWQDIKELLDRGIDVFTTLNVQHIESLNDDVAQIIHAPVKETVPDSMLELADTIELIDISPDDLLKRLHEGKVYLPEQAALAADSFFRKGNLTALRALALRATAERVGAQVLLYRQGHDIQHVWPAMEKILVCVGGGSECLKLIRAAKRIATSLGVEWIAIHVDAPQLKLTEEKRNEAMRNLRFAEHLGAETRVISGFDIVKEIMDFARSQNVTQIMIFKHIRQRWLNLFSRNLADEVVRYSGEIDVYLMTGSVDADKKPLSKITPTPMEFRGYAISLAVIAFATLVNFVLFPYVRPSNLIMIYLLGVTVVALLGKMGPSLLASFSSVLAYDFFFSSTVFTFAIPDVESLSTLLVMLIVAQVISQLSILTRQQALSARQAENQTSALYTLSRQLAGTRGINKLLDISTVYLANYFNSEVVALVPQNGALLFHAGSHDQQLLSEKEQSVAQWVYEMGQVAGLGTDTLAFSSALYLPLLGSQEVIGVLRIQPMNANSFVSPEKMHILEACAQQIAVAIEVDRLHDRTKMHEVQSEVDQVRNALLQSVAHDLRTPLVAIIGAASTQIELSKKLDAHAIETNGRDIYFEAQQLSRLINNLLQISFLEGYQVKLQKHPSSLKEVINVVLSISDQQLADRSVHLHLPKELPDIPFDQTLIQEVLLNLIDNAVKFTTTDSAIDINVAFDETTVVISVEDLGPGLVPDELNQLFEKYYRGRKLTSERGLGLGLALCRMIVEAHGGNIWAENRRDQGAAFRFSLPLK